MSFNKVVHYIMSFRRCWREFGYGCAMRSFASSEFLQFWPTFRKASFLPNNPIIIDIGANVGSFARACQLRWERAEILCCEPIPEIYELLKIRFKTCPSIHCFNIGISNYKGRAVLKQSKDSAFSSFLSFDDQYLDFGSGRDVIPEIDVECKTLAELINEYVKKPIDLIKVDVQGNELNVISTLRDSDYPVRAIQLELSFYHVYKGQPLIDEVVSVMEPLGYNLVEIYSPLKNNRGVVIHVEGFFRLHSDK